MTFLRQAFTVMLALLILLLVPASSSTQYRGVSISTPDEIKAEFDSVLCKNEERLSAAKVLFEKAGAHASDIVVEKYRSVENLVVRKPGTSQEIIVIGAHYDKVSAGCGAVDNWSGVVTIAHLYKSLKDAPLTKTMLFVAFGKEEEGLIGSHAMVGAISKDQLAQYCEMINIDSFGLAVPQVADNMSSKKLGAFTADLAREMKLPFNHASIVGADGDSSSFLSKKIPAITLHGLNNDWSSVIHSRNDQASKINAVSVYLGTGLLWLWWYGSTD
jgi:Iap family predicted aminopeptidase